MKKLIKYLINLLKKLFKSKAKGANKSIKIKKRLLWYNKKAKQKFDVKVYIKQVSKNLFHVCYEYGKISKKNKKIRVDKVLRKFNNLERAVKYKNKINYGY
jgi:hypothetical protein